MYSLKPSFLICLLSLLLLLASFFAFISPVTNVIIFTLILLLVVVGSLIKLEFGALAILVELLLGGHGYLFSIDIFGYAISFRIALFIAVGCIWLFRILKQRRLPTIVTSNIKIPFLVFIAFVFIGAIFGLLKNDLALVFYDANAYLALGYIFFFTDIFTDKLRIQRAVTVVISVSLGLAVATIVLLGIYATFHYDDSLRGAVAVSDQTKEELNTISDLGEDISIGQKITKPSDSLILNPLDVSKTKPSTYRWLRDTGTAEISYISGRFFRVFFPSSLIAIVSLFLLLTSFFSKRLRFKGNYIVATVLLISLYISFSRSLWVGVGMGILASAVVLFKNHPSSKKILYVSVLILILITILALFTGVGDTFTTRINSILNPTEDVAGVHRIELLKSIFEKWKDNPILGSGFGTTITFPTVLPNGSVIQTAFLIYEWSYFDLAVKTGILGLLSFLWFLFTIALQLLKQYSTHKNVLPLALLAGLITLSIANITTPIFTHPLGLGALAFISIFLFPLSYENSNSSSHLE